MLTIYKYPINLFDMQVVQLPRFSRPLCIQQQHGSLQLWARVETGEPLQDYIIHCYGTGHPVAEIRMAHEFLGTVQMQSGALVFHFFGFYAKPITEQV